MPFSVGLKKIALVIIFVLLILNPYTIYLNLAYLVVPLIFAGFLYRFKGLDNEIIFLSGVMILISMIGVLVSHLNGIGQFNHLKVAFQLLIYVLLAYSIFIIFYSRNFSFDEFVFCILLAVVFNSVVIVLQVYLPAFRAFTESFLVPSGNINWKEGFRYRGIASGGGATLSVLVPVAVVVCLYLYSQKYFSIVSVFFYLSVLIFSIFFIGRTGLVLLPVVAFSYLFFELRKYFLKTSVFLCVAFFLVYITSDMIKVMLVDQYGIGFYNYSLGFLLDGVQGIKEEGTVDTVIGFLAAMPTTFPEMLIGCGYYGGESCLVSTDSGYVRMFLSVGYVFGLLFYMCFFLMFRNVFMYKPFLFLTIGGLLLIAEIKEPLLFTGYASRLYFLILVFGVLSKRFRHQNIQKHSASGDGALLSRRVS
jgi:hypothetical protein